MAELTEAVAARIAAMPGGTVFFSDNFSDLCPAYRIGRILTALERDGRVRRRGRGIYSKPFGSGPSPLHPSLPHLVEAVAARLGVRLIPTGRTAAGMLGLCRTDPSVSTYLTSGTSRTFVLDGTTVIFRRGRERRFRYKTDLAPLVEQALLFLGKDHVGPTELAALKAAFDKNAEKETFPADVPFLPAWMKRVLLPIL